MLPVLLAKAMFFNCLVGLHLSVNATILDPIKVISLNVGPDLFGGAEFEAPREATGAHEDPDRQAKNAGATKYVVRNTKSYFEGVCAPRWPWAISLHQFSKTYLPYLELWGADREDVETRLKPRVVPGGMLGRNMSGADFYQLSDATQTALVEKLSLRARLQNYRAWFTELFASHLELCARRTFFRECVPLMVMGRDLAVHISYYCRQRVHFLCNCRDEQWWNSS